MTSDGSTYNSKYRQPVIGNMSSSLEISDSLRNVINQRNKQLNGNTTRYFSNKSRSILKERLCKADYSGVKKEKFNDELYACVNSWDNVDILQDHNHSTQVYLSTFEVLSQYFPDFKGRINSPLKPEDKLILKVYDPLHIERLHMGEYYKIRVKKTDGYYNKYFTEIKCYEAISEQIDKIPQKKLWIPQNKIKIPQLYDYGMLHLQIEDSYEFGGFFMLMEYVPNDPSTITQRMVYDGCRQVEQLHKLDLYHNNIREENFRIHRGSVYFIDFSDASISKSNDKENSDVNKFILSTKTLLADVKTIKVEQERLNC